MFSTQDEEWGAMPSANSDQSEDEVKTLDSSFEQSWNQTLFGWDLNILRITGSNELSLQQITIGAEVVQGEDEEEETRVNFFSS